MNIKDLDHDYCNTWRAPFKVLSGGSVMLVTAFSSSTWMILGLAKKTKSLGEFSRSSFYNCLNLICNVGKKISTSLLRDGSQSRPSTNDESQARSRSSTIDNMLPDLCRVTSPDSDLHRCTPNCPMTLPEKRVKAHVVRISHTLHSHLNWKSKRFHCPLVGIMSRHMTTISRVRL